ncbi:hypothetical protein D3C72_1580950 [compost metagenome]
MARWRDHLDHQQAIGLGRLRQDVAHIAGIGALAAHGARHGSWLDQARRTAGRGGRAAKSDLGIAHCRDADRCIQRDIHGVRRAVLKDALAVTDLAPLLSTGLYGDRTRQHNDAQLALARVQAQRFARLKPVRGETDMRPASRLGRHLDDLAAGLGRFHQQRAHAASRPRRGMASTSLAR